MHKAPESLNQCALDSKVTPFIPNDALPTQLTSSASHVETEHCIHTRFEQQTRATPEAIALSHNGNTLTYAELNQRADQLARQLRRSGVGLETPVALYLERSFEMVTAILGVLKAGGVYVPVDLAYPAERVAFMLQDAAAPVLLTMESLKPKLPANSAKILFVDSLSEPGTCTSEDQQTAPRPCPDNAAYIIYTSGSTGKPKGVIVTHRNVVRLLKQTDHWYGFNEKDVWPLFHSYAFDVSVWELWGSLFYGGRLVIVPYLTTRSPHAFYELLSREQITVLNQTPSAFRQLIWAEETATTKLPLQLRYVICAGEALELQSLKPWFARHGDSQPKIVNMYGITEITVHATFRIICQEDLSNGSGSVIGVPIPDLQLHLVDEDLKPVQKGRPGEICVAGPGVARGYLNRPELTASRFIADPFSTEKNALMYRSGDLAQFSERGELEYLGRMDHQVKIRGFRVELGEIESALNAHPAIRESVVIACDDSTGGKRLVAYVVPQKESPYVTQIRAELSKRLPDYMVPATVVFLEAFPLNNNGKIDRRALPAPPSSRPKLQADFLAPRSDEERALCGIWAEVLQLDSIGVHDNFFELGGDSILSIRMLTRAQQLGLHFAVHDVFQTPTVAGLVAKAREVEPLDPRPLAAAFSLVKPADREHLPADAEDAYPLSRLQLGMFFHNELNPRSSIYHDVFSFRITAGFEAPALQHAVERLVARHPVLRTSFHLEEFSEPLQIVHRPPEESAPGSTARFACPEITLRDLRGFSPNEQAVAIASWIDREKQNAFIRSQAPLVRFQALLLDERAFQFVLSFHHACLDGWSLAALITELFADYARLINSRDLKEISTPQIAYRDFLALEQDAIQSDPARVFWTNKLRDASISTLPRWPKKYRETGHEQKRGPELAVPAEVFVGLQKLAQECGVPLKTVMIAAHTRVAALLYGSTDIVTGLLCNGRPEAPGGDRLLGLFLNTVPLRLQLPEGSWRDLVKHTFAGEQELMPHRRFPLAEIQKLHGGRRPFQFACDFVHFHVYREIQSVAGIDVAEGHYFEANDITAFTTFVLDTSSNQLQLHIDYDPNELCREQVTQFSHYYLRTLRAMATAPEALCLDFSPLPESELQQQPTDWNNTRAENTNEDTIHSLFEQQALAGPDAVAVHHDNRALSYSELNEAANRLAAEIRASVAKQPPQGFATLAPSQPLVGIYLDRTANMLVALLAVLKSGAAYVPLDPAYPQERISLMAEDARLSLLITENKLLTTIPNWTLPTICVDGPVGTSIHLPSSRFDLANSAATPDSLAYVIYTSGSTGKPKGVEISHRSVVNLLKSAAEKTQFNHSDRLLAVTTLSFDIAGLELFLPLICGGTVVLASREASSNGWTLAGLLKSSEATVMQATPATWRLLLESGWTGNKTLRVICGGEALATDLADTLLNLSGEVWNFYGPTETTIWSTAWKMVPGERIRIGQPLANTQVYVLDERMQPVPVGTAGQLHIGGLGLAAGYHNAPELTSQKFVWHKFPDHSHATRLYKTGDLARFLPDGSLECLGRKDGQVKIRGHRIELGDIEAALRSHHGVREAVVTAQVGNFDDKRLVAYVTPSNGGLESRQLRDFLDSKLPHFMVPSQWVVLDKLPTTPNGKIDRNQLPAPNGARPSGTDFIEPVSGDEIALANIWKEVLSLDRIGMQDNIFDLGVESLSATRAFARINRQFQANFSLQEIFENPTIASLLGLLQQRKGAKPLSPIPRRTHRGAAASLTQLGLAFSAEAGAIGAQLMEALQQCGMG